MWNSALIILIAIFLLLPQSVHAQNSRKDDVPPGYYNIAEIKRLIKAFETGKWERTEFNEPLHDSRFPLPYDKISYIEREAALTSFALWCKLPWKPYYAKFAKAEEILHPDKHERVFIYLYFGGIQKMVYERLKPTECRKSIRDRISLVISLKERAMDEELEELIQKEMQQREQNRWDMEEDE